MQILANIFNIKISRINTDQGGALGAAILAAVGVGAFSSVEEACFQIVHTTEEFVPEPNSVEIYRALHEKFKSLYQALKPWFYISI